MQRFLFVLLGMAMTGTFAAPSSAAELQAGVAVVDISPPRGYRMSGYFRERLNTGTHDPLQAKALFLRQGDEQAALVFCDLIGIAREVSGRARALAAKKTGIPAANILIAATHSHTGPLYMGALRQYFHDQTVAAKGEDTHEKIDYPAVLAERLANAIDKAKKSARPIVSRRRHGTSRDVVVQPSFSHEGRHGAFQSGQTQSQHRAAGRPHRSRRRTAPDAERRQGSRALDRLRPAPGHGWRHGILGGLSVLPRTQAAFGPGAGGCFTVRNRDVRRHQSH